MPSLYSQIKQGLKDTKEIDAAIETLKATLPEKGLFFAHSLRTGLILKKMGADQFTISCGILHNIPKKLNGETAKIVKKMWQLRHICAPKKPLKTKPFKKWRKNPIGQQAENIRKMFFAVAKDIRPILVFLAAEVDEMQNMVMAWPEEKQLMKSGVALEILAPLAHSLGMAEIKGELEDTAFPYLYPKEYKWLLDNVKEKYAASKIHAETIKPLIAETLKQGNIKTLKIDARAKHYFSFYQKLLKHDMDIDQIYDLVALRVIVPDISACYKALGVIHNTWKPLPGRIKDYIASPKSNGYRSLHTTVECQHCNKPIEIQIKTDEMHREAEYGVAAHIIYKEGHGSRIRSRWTTELRKWIEETKNPTKVSEHLRYNLFKDSIFVLTPKNEIINLPKGSTPVDFAYAVHSDIGDHCEGALINNKMVSLDTTLETGQVVKIITSKAKVPSSDWLRFAKSPRAKNRIKGFLEKAYGISLAKPGKAIKERVALIKKIFPKRKKKEKKISPVLIGGQAGIAIKMAKCCKPKQGDAILAFVTKGEGASVHQANCKNLNKMRQKEPQRVVEATWNKSQQA